MNKDILIEMRNQAQSPEELEAIDKIIVMILCLKKHDRIRELLGKN